MIKRNHNTLISWLLHLQWLLWCHSCNFLSFLPCSYNFCFCNNINSLPYECEPALCPLLLWVHILTTEINIFELTNRPINQPTDQPTNQPTDQPTDWPTDQPTNQPTNRLTDQPTNQPTNQPTDQHPCSSPWKATQILHFMDPEGLLCMHFPCDIIRCALSVCDIHYVWSQPIFCQFD